MTDIELLEEFCNRFGYECIIAALDDGRFIAYCMGEEYYFYPDGSLDE